MKKLTVLDPGYLYPTGHHHALNTLILRKAEAWGCEVTILANKALAEGGFGQRLLSPTIYPHPHTIEQLVSWCTENAELFRHDLIKQREKILGATHIIIHTCTPELIPPNALLAGDLIGSRSDIRIYLNFFSGGFFWLNGTDVEGQAQEIFQNTIQALRPEYKNVVVSSDTPSLASKLSEWAQRKVSVSNYPREFPDQTAQQGAPSPDEEATFLYVGKIRREKGTELILDAIKKIASKGSKIRVRFVVPDAGASTYSLAKQYEDFVSLRVLPHDNEMEYFAEIAQADFILCPYLPYMYRDRGSGVFLDALGIGVPIIATRGTGFIDKLFNDELDAVEFMESASGNGLFAAMENALENKAKRKSAAQKVAPRIRQIADPDHWLSDIVSG